MSKVSGRSRGHAYPSGNDRSRSLAVASRVLTDMCLKVRTPRSLCVYLLVKYGEWDQLAELKFEPANYCDALPVTFSADYALSSLLKKFVDLPCSFDRSRNALRAFVSAEKKCRDTNRMLSAWSSGISAHEVPPLVSDTIEVARRKIHALIGDSPPPFSQLVGGWGPGATTSIKRRSVLPDTKYSEYPLRCGSRCLTAVREIVAGNPLWLSAMEEQAAISPNSECILVEDFARFSTVPKTSKTDRSILIEPTFNSYLQKGYGYELRRHLKRVGIDLNDQSRNQAAAAAAYDYGFATIDLEAASDSVSSELVRMLLPPDWFEALDDCRSRKTRIKGIGVKMQKFSSMGNGFTFELETLIFWALCSAVVRPGSLLLVYGDDIVVSQEYAGRCIEVLQGVGFTVNTAKTYVSGDFFESCGEHYYKGVLVTPPYQKTALVAVSDYIRLSNRIYRFNERTGNNFQTPSLARLVPESRIGPYMPDGDLWLMRHSYELQDDTRWRQGPFGAEFRVQIPLFESDLLPGVEPALLLAWLSQRRVAISYANGRVGPCRPIDVEPSYGNVPLPAREGRLRWRWVLI